MGLIVHNFGVKHLDGIYPSDILYTWNEKLSDTMVGITTDIQSRPLDTRESTGGVGQKLVSWGFTDRFGLITSATFLKDLLSTIRMITHSTMTSPIWNLWLSPHTVECTVADPKL